MKIASNIFAKAQTIVEQLSPVEKIKLLRKLEKETWKQRFTNLLRKLDSRSKKIPVSQNDINTAVENARQEIYDRCNRH